jgi:hypothetical protein
MNGQEWMNNSWAAGDSLKREIDPKSSASTQNSYKRYNSIFS